MRVFEPGRIYEISQMYDENGNAFYPVTHKDCIIGGVDGLDIGITLSTTDYQFCITGDHKGSLIMKEFNNLIYVINVDITRADDTPFRYDKDIILAKDIPELYSAPFFTVMGDCSTEIRMWLENHYLKARLLRKQSMNEVDTSINRIQASGILIR